MRDSGILKPHREMLVLIYKQQSLPLSLCTYAVLAVIDQLHLSHLSSLDLSFQLNLRQILTRMGNKEHVDTNYSSESKILFNVQSKSGECWAGPHQMNVIILLRFVQTTNLSNSKMTATDLRLSICTRKIKQIVRSAKRKTCQERSTIVILLR